MTFNIHAIIKEVQTGVDELRKKYPVGTRLAFYIHHGQKNPSTGVVVGHSIDVSTQGDVTTAYPRIAVNHDQAKFRGRYPRRQLSLDSIVGILP